ncbi:caspase family protein [Phormidesmis sp. 146-35]
MKRRSFLQQTGLLLAGLGGLTIAPDRYSQVLAQPTTRRLALLVGINQYRGATLNGCLTDVELQRELLIHRFRFHPSDVLVLTDQQATRSHIETAFTQHLLNQAKSGDVVVFHFSGYGNLINTGTTIEESQTQLITSNEPAFDESAIGLTEETLLLLLKSLPTDQVTTVLDAGYVYSGMNLLGNLRVRSRPSLPMARLDDAELAFQEQRLAALSLDRAQVGVQRRSGQIPGVVLTAATASQTASEARWNGFSAGLFTYYLTQQLWHSTPATTLRFSLTQTAEAIGRVDTQQPNLAGQKSRDRPLKPYHIQLSDAGADGVITAIEDTVAQVWLASLPAQLEQGTQALLTVSTGTRLQIYAKDGLTAKAKIQSENSAAPLQVGQWVQEAVRIIPHNLGLTVAIESSLERIERVDAVSAFSAISSVSAVIAGEQAADFLFGKVRETTQVAALPTAPIAGVVPPSGYGLFSQGQVAIANTSGESGEAVKLAVKRLVPHLQRLLAAKLLNLTVNTRSQTLGIQAELIEKSSLERVLIQQKTARISQGMVSNAGAQEGKRLTLAIGTSLQYRLENQGDQPLYFVLLGLDNSGQSFVIWADEAAVSPKTVLTVPTLEWTVRSPIGLAETHLICSRVPFSQTQSLVQSPSQSGIRSIERPLEVAQAILKDLHQASQNAEKTVGAIESYLLDINEWATFRFVYQVV